MDCPKGAEVARFPNDPLVEILSHVPFRSLSRFRCVSKSWRDLIDDPLHRKKLPQTLEGFFYEIHSHGYVEGEGNNEGGVKKLARGGCVDFINLSRRSVPLVDPSLSFLRNVPGIENIRIMEASNGLLLFEHGNHSDNTSSYIVCNPATEQYVAVPDSDWTPPPYMSNGTAIYFIFDPSVSSHFHLVQFWNEVHVGVTSVHTYSSKTGVWTHSESAWDTQQKERQCERWRYRNCFVVPEKRSALINGLLYLIYDSGEEDRVLDGDHIIAVDVEGKTQRIIPAPFQVCEGKCRTHSDFVGQSQGHLHYINHEEQNYADDYDDGISSGLCADGRAQDIDDAEERSYELSIWVLKDDDAQELVLKHRVSFLHLFGEKSCEAGIDFNVIDIHPDRDLVFFTRNGKLISYDMDSKEVCALHTFDHGYMFTPYVPYCSESLAFTI